MRAPVAAQEGDHVGAGRRCGASGERQRVVFGSEPLVLLDKFALQRSHGGESAAEGGVADAEEYAGETAERGRGHVIPWARCRSAFYLAVEMTTFEGPSISAARVTLPLASSSFFKM